MSALFSFNVFKNMFCACIIHRMHSDGVCIMIMIVIIVHVFSEFIYVKFILFRSLLQNIISILILYSHAIYLIDVLNFGHFEKRETKK